MFHLSLCLTTLQSPTCVITEDPDPFHRDTCSLLSQLPKLLANLISWHSSTLSCSLLLWHLVLPHPLLYLLQVLGSYGYTADSEKGITLLPVNDHGIDILYAMAPHHLGTQYVYSPVREVFCTEKNFLVATSGFLSVQFTVTNAQSSGFSPQRHPKIILLLTLTPLSHTLPR